MKSFHVAAHALVILLVCVALFPMIQKRAFSSFPVYLSVQPKALPPLTDMNSSVYGLEIPVTPSAVGGNFTVELHLSNATVANVPRGVNGVEVHFYFGNILTYAVPTGFTDFLGMTGGVLFKPLVYGRSPDFYAADGTEVPNPPFIGAVMYKAAGASTRQPFWNGQDGVVANITFQIIRQPQANETSVSLPLDYTFSDIQTTVVDPNTGEVSPASADHDRISGSLALDSNYKPPSNYTLTVQQSPAGSGTVNVKVNGVIQAPPYIFSNGTIVQAVATPNVGYNFSNWTLDGTNAGSANPYSITMNGNHTLTANYQTQYYLTVASQYDSPTPLSGWFDPGATIIESVTSPVLGPSGTRYACTGWTGTGSVPASGNGSTVTFTINVNSSITWNWKTQYQVTLGQTGVGGDFMETIVTIDGTGYNYSALPVSLWWDNSSSHAFSFSSPLVTNTGKQYVWASTSGLSALQSGSMTVTTSGNMTGNFKTQYYLTVRTDPNGITTISGQGWYDASQNVTLAAPLVANYQFNRWDIDGTAQSNASNPITINMTAVHTATAHYTSTLPLGHDIAITNVTPLKTVVGQSYSMGMDATIVDQGDYAETFNVTIYANQTIIATLEYINLTSRNSVTITSVWNTTGFSYGNYTISAYALPVSGETNTANNNCTGGWTTVTIPGDVDGDFRVRLQDLVSLAKAYGSKPSDSNWNPNTDIDSNGIVGLSDLVALAQHYGTHYP
jgi:hypothetical protein